MKRVKNILMCIFYGVCYSIIPVLIVYGGTQTSKSRINKYGATSPQGIEAIQIMKWLNIAGIVVICAIVLYVLRDIFKVLKNKYDPVGEYENLGTGPVLNINLVDGDSSNEVKVEENFFGDKIYKDANGNIVAKESNGILGDKIIRDSSNNIIGKGSYNSFTGQTEYKDNNYNDIATKKRDAFGNDTIKTKDGKEYVEKKNILGSTIKKK